MQQIRIAKMNANDPDITIISPRNAGIVCLVVVCLIRIRIANAFNFFDIASLAFLVTGFFATMNGLATMETAFFGTQTRLLATIASNAF